MAKNISIAISSFVCAAVISANIDGRIFESNSAVLLIPSAAAQSAVRSLSAGSASASGSAAQNPSSAEVTASAETSPCLQKLQEKKIADEAKPKKKKNAGLFGAIGGAILGGVIGSQLCKNERGGASAGCIAKYGAIGGAAGFALGKLIEKSDERKVAEASYKAALTQRPVSIALKNGCALAEPKGEPVYEPREVQLAMLETVSPPAGTLRAIGGFRQPAAAMPLNPSTAAARKPLSSLQPKTPAFVMGSADNGNWLLVARQDPEQGYVASGWARAAGWTEATPPAEEQTISGQTYKSASVKVEVPCSESTVTIRNEATNKQESPSVKSCIMPDGVPEIA